MKNFVIASALTLMTAAGASAASSSDFQRFGVDADSLTNTQRLTISNVIAGGDSNGEISAFIRSYLKNS